MRGRSPESDGPPYIAGGGLAMALAVVMLWDRRGEPSSTMDLVLIVIGAVGFFLTSYGVVIAGVRRALRELDLDPTNQSD